MTSGVIADIQRGSMHDGPGIRTCVFLQGCNMRCAWCHNPETIPMQGQVQVFAEKCIGCRACEAACESGAVKVGAGGPVIDRQKCLGSGECAKACFAGALVVPARRMTTEALLVEILRDKPYYKDVGGVTFTGGEVFMQAGFLLEMMKLCKGEGIHVAVETNFSRPWDVMAEAMPFIDLIMLDVKLMDEAAHRRWTGISNAGILENIRRLDKLSKPYLVRTPVIPGVNDGEVEAIAQWLSALDNCLYYELLPYNPLAEGKFQRLSKPYVLDGLAPPSKEAMRVLERMAAAKGIQTRCMEG